MIAIGIDISKGRSTVAVIGEGKKLLHKPFDIAHTKDGLAELVAFVRKYGEDVLVVMEHTGVYYKVVAETLHKAGVRVSAVNPVLINQYGDNTLRKGHTDKSASMKIGRYTIENREDLFDYSPEESLRDSLKSVVRQFEFEDRNLTAHSNNLNALLERVFPGIDGFFSSPAKPNGHQKWIDFVIDFWHNDCVSGISEASFIKKYAHLCKKYRYNCKVDEAKQIHAMSRQNLTTLPKDDITKTLVLGAAEQTLQLSVRVEKLREQMIMLAKQLPEFETVDAIYGVGETLAAKLIGEAGDVRRFASKRSLASYAGVDPGKDDSGKHVAKHGRISRTGDAILRKAAFQVVDCYLKHSPADEPLYQFLDKKRSEGKEYYVYMTAGCNKFLRIYYARVMEHFAALDAKSKEQSVAEESVTATEQPLRIIPTSITNTNPAFTCEQDRATLGSDLSGSQGLAYTDGGGQLAAL